MNPPPSASPVSGDPAVDPLHARATQAMLVATSSVQLLAHALQLRRDLLRVHQSQVTLCDGGSSESIAMSIAADAMAASDAAIRRILGALAEATAHCDLTVRAILNEPLPWSRISLPSQSSL